MSTGKTYSTKYLLDSNNNRGAEGQVLISTSEGVNWSDGSDITGGPYLPLAGGTMTLATSPLILPGEESNQFKIAFTGASASSGLSTVDQSGAGLYIGANSRVNNSGVVVYHDSALPSSGIYFDGWDGDDMEFYTGSSGNPTKRLTLSAGGDAIFTGNVGIGTTSPGDKLTVQDGTITSTDSSGTNYAKLDRFSGLTLKGNGAGTRGVQTPNTDALTLGTNNTERIRITSTGNVGIGTTSPSYKLSVNGSISAGGKITYTKSSGSLDTTGYAVAGLTTSSNGLSAGFIFTCFGHTGGYQKVVYSCANVSGTWTTYKVIDEGTNQLDIEASANGATITFTFKSRSGTMYYTPRVTVEATGSSINNTYA